MEPESIPGPKDMLSICDVMKEDASEIIKKAESYVPKLFQSYSEIYTQFLHTIDDIFGTCYIAEREFFNKLDLNPELLRQLKLNSELAKSQYIQNMELSWNMFEGYAKMRLEAVRLFDQYVHTMMESYSEMLSNFNNVMRPLFTNASRKTRLL